MSSKSGVLKILEQNKGKSVSGEEIATKMQISRAAVWKAVRELKKDGYQISASTNRGYYLSPNNDLLSAEAIRLYLNNKEIANKIHVGKSLASTNQMSKKLAIEGASDKTIVLSEEQTSGKGRLGRSFFSPANSGIYMSIILRPQISLTSSLLITTASAVAVCRAIETVTGIQPQIKWVNDILVNEKKVCGILTEAVTDFESGNVEFIIIGIGVNFCTPKVLFPPELQRLAGSLYDIKPDGTDRNQLAGEIINQIEKITSQIETREFLTEYKKRSLILQKEIQIISSDKITNALAIDIDRDGCLVVKEKDGSIHTISTSEVTIRKKK